MILIYLWFFVVLALTAKFNKEMLEDLTYRTGYDVTKNMVKENTDWHVAQLVLWIAVYLMPLFVIAVMDYKLASLCEYLVRLVFFGVMFSGVYNVLLNRLRGLDWMHYGTNDFMPTAYLLVISAVGIIAAGLYELGVLDCVRFWI